MPMPVNRKLMKLVWERIATSELGLEQVLTELRGQGVKTVSVTTIYRWLERDPVLREQSARARRLQAELLHDRAQMEAQTPRLGKREKLDKDGKVIEVTTGDNVERSKLIVQTLLRRAGQLDPKKYGERTTLAGDPEAPLVQSIDAGELIERIARKHSKATKA